MTPPPPAVSVVIPTHNRSALLRLTLDSVFAQTFRDFEVIVVDDGSTDDTLDMLRSFMDTADLRVIEQPQRGPAAARRCGADQARGEFIALLDDDDLWPRNKLEWQVDTLRRHPDAALVYGFMESFGLERPWRWPPPDGPSGWVRPAFLRKNWIRSPGQALIRLSCVQAVGGFDATVWSADDWDLYLRLANVGPFVYVHRHALHYRAHTTNLSHQAWLLFRQSWRVHSRHAGALPRRGHVGTWLRCRASLLNSLRLALQAGRRARRQVRRQSR